MIMAGNKRVRAPDGLNARGRAFWDHVVVEYEPTAAELPLVAETARTLDVLERLDRRARSRDTDDDTRLTVYRELRLQRIALTRLLGQLGLEDDDGQALPTPRQARAKAAADARWGNRGLRPVS
jgi:hypothetical protein